MLRVARRVSVTAVSEESCSNVGQIFSEGDEFGGVLESWRMWGRRYRYQEVMPPGRLQGRPWVRCLAGERQRVLPRVSVAGVMESFRVEVRSIGLLG